MSDKLTPEQIAAIEWQLSGYRARIATWGGLGTEHAQDATADIAALLAHVAALDAELAAAREENVRLRKVAEAVRVFTAWMPVYCYRGKWAIRAWCGNGFTDYTADSVQGALAEMHKRQESRLEHDEGPTQEAE